MKKFFITLMCIVMVVCFMPTVAMAGEEPVEPVAKIGEQSYTTLQAAIDDVIDGSETTIILLKDVGENILIDSGKNIVLDLDGHTLTDNGDNTITCKGELYLKSSTYGGSVVNKTNYKKALYIESDASVVIDGIVIGNSEKGSDLIYVSSGATVKIKNGTFTQNANSYLLKASAPKDVTIEGGEFIQNGDSSMMYSYGSGTSVVIKGGIFTNNSQERMLYSSNSGKYSISNGTFNGGNAVIMLASSSCTVSGGRFSNPVSATNCVVGFVPTTQAVDGYYGVEVITQDNAPVVLSYKTSGGSVTTYYADPSIALNDAGKLTDASDVLVTVKKDVSTGSNIYAYKANMVIENGVTLTASSVTVANSSSTANVTLKNYGTIIATFIDTRSGGNGSLINENTGVIECKYFNSELVGSGSNGWSNNGTIKTSNKANLKNFTNNGKIIGTTDGASMIVSGTPITMDGVEYKPNTYEWNGTNWRLSGNIYLLRNGEIIKTYDKFLDACTEAVPDDILILNKDISQAFATFNISKKLTLDLNGHTANNTSQFPALVIQDGGNLIITDSSENETGKITSYTGEIIQVKSGGTLTLEKGTLETTGTGCTTVFMGDDINNLAGANGAKVIIKGGKVLSSESIAIRAMGKGTAENPTVGTASTLTITNGFIQGGTHAIAGFGSNAHNTVIEISGGRVIGKDTAIYHPQDGTLSISGNAYLEGETGVQLCSGKGVIASITGGEIRATGVDQREDKTGGDGFIPDGAALSIVNRNYPGGIPVMNVSSGKFTSVQSKAVLAYTWSNNTASEWNEAGEYFTITGGAYSSDVSAYMTENYVEYAMRNGTYIVKGSGEAKPTFTTGNYWSDLNGKVYTEMYSAPYIPSTPTDSLKTARTEAIKAVADYVNPADYEEAQQDEIKTIVDNAKKDIEAAKTADEIKAIEAAAKAQLDKLETAEEMALIRTIQQTQFIARSKRATLNGKKAIRVTWNKPADLEFDGYEIYRSTERYKGYGTEPFFTTTNQKYTNNKGLKVGKTYYYRVRGFKYVNDEKVYTEYSLKAWRTVK